MGGGRLRPCKLAVTFESLASGDSAVAVADSIAAHLAPSSTCTNMLRRNPKGDGKKGTANYRKLSQNIYDIS